MRTTPIVPLIPPLPADHPSTVLWFGGSFDPPTTAHRDLPEAARAAVDAHTLVYCPAARSPFKPDPPTAGDRDRLDMLAAALADNPRAAISTAELDRHDATPDAPSFTADTLERIARHLPASATLRLLIGEDQARSLHRWREPERIVRLAEPLIMQRRAPADGQPQPAEHTLADHLARHCPSGTADTWRRRIVATPASTASATRVRELLAQPPCHDRDAELAELLPPTVIAIIRERNLYA